MTPRGGQMGDGRLRARLGCLAAAALLWLLLGLAISLICDI